MRRLFYLGLGVAIGVAATRRVGRVVRAWTPEGVAGRLGESVRDFTADVRASMAERESELREALTRERDDDVDVDDADVRNVRKAR